MPQRIHKDHNKHTVEKCDALSVLKKVRVICYPEVSRYIDHSHYIHYLLLLHVIF